MLWVQAPITGTQIQCSVTQPPRPIRCQYSGQVIMYRPIRAVTRLGRGAGAGGDATSRPLRPRAGTRPSRRPSRQSLKVKGHQFPGHKYIPHIYLTLEISDLIGIGNFDSGLQYHQYFIIHGHQGGLSDLLHHVNCLWPSLLCRHWVGGGRGETRPSPGARHLSDSRPLIGCRAPIY